MGALKLITQILLVETLGITEGRDSAPACNGSTLFKTLLNSTSSKAGVKQTQEFLQDAHYEHIVTARCQLQVHHIFLCVPLVFSTVTVHMGKVSVPQCGAAGEGGTGWFDGGRRLMAGVSSFYRK